MPGPLHTANHPAYHFHRKSTQMGERAMQQPISLRRRQLMIAGVAGAAVPAGVLAGLVREEAYTDSLPAGDLVVSGRVVDAHGKAIPGALVSSTPDASTTTDGDGR